METQLATMQDASPKAKGNVSERMAALRKRRQERNLGSKEVQPEDGVLQIAASSSLRAGAREGSEAHEYPSHQSYEQWEEYFADLAAAGCDNDVKLSAFELCLLTVHGVYSQKVEDLSEKAEATPHFWSPADVDAYCSSTARGHTAQLSEVREAVHNVRQVYSAEVRTTQERVAELEEEITQMEQQMIDIASPSGRSPSLEQGSVLGDALSPRIMKAELIDEMKKELTLADLENKRIAARLNRIRAQYKEGSHRALLNTVSSMRRLYLERGFENWKLLHVRWRQRERMDADLAMMDARVPLEDSSPPEASGRRGGMDEDIFGQQGNFDSLYEDNLSAMVAAQKKRLNRLQEGGDSGSEDSEDHYASDEEMNQALRAGEEGGKVGVILSYTAGLKLKQKKERWTMAFMRLHNEWIISAIVRTAWAFAMWTSLTVREQASSRLEQVKELDSKYNEVHDQLAHVSSKLDLFRQGRVGTYSGKGRYDSDDEIEDDYVQLSLIHISEPTRPY
eukprot:TRINITY_DN38926_c0_g1_i2.p1 TRINITY_DN38926_c0_g1~~TRINITY_DN38926_c0_g1_i2.p1  ORF type:complete len:507 (+),score=137.08 TRINITY_DN38926_c0_g1_i2:51-1571(+)